MFELILGGLHPRFLHDRGHFEADGNGTGGTGWILEIEREAQAALEKAMPPAQVDLEGGSHRVPMPFNEPVPGGDLPGGRAKDHHGQVPTVPIPGHVLNVLADCSVETAIVVAPQQVGDVAAQGGCVSQFQAWHRCCERAVRCQAGCCSIRACNHARSSPVSVRPWTRIGSTAARIYPSGRFEFSEKCPNSSIQP